MAIAKSKPIANRRIINVKYYDKNPGNLKEITIPPRPKNFKIVFHLYIVFAKKRDINLQKTVDRLYNYKHTVKKTYI